MPAPRKISPEVAGTLERVLARAVTREEAAAALIALEDESGGKAALTSVRRALAKVPTITLYTPAALSRDSLAKIVAWCRNTLSPQVLLEVHVDPTAVGGCRVAWNGVLHDLTLTHYLHKAGDAYGKRIDEMLTKARPRAKKT